MPSQVALSSVFRLALKILCSTFSYLYLFERIFSDSLQRWFSCSFCVCLCYTLEALFHEKIKKSKWSNYCSLRVRKSLFQFYWKEMIGNSLTNHWLDMNLRRRKKDDYVDIRKLLQTFSGAWELKYLVH